MADFTAWVEQNKALWTRVYNEVIHPDLEKEWKKREERHKEELKQKEEQTQVLFNHLQGELVKSARLSTENERLKEQLESQVQPTVSGVDLRRLFEENERLKQHLATNHDDLAEKISGLSKKYQDASQKVKYLERKNAAVMQKNKDMKESVRAWQEYADRQSGSHKSKNEAKAEDAMPRISAGHLMPDDRPHVPSSPVSAATVRTPRSLADVERSSPAPIVPLPGPLGAVDLLIAPNVVDSGERSTSAATTPKAAALLQGNEPQQYRPEPATANPSSSQTTVDEHVELTNRYEPVVDAEEEDIPEFVSERSLKRKRRPSKSRFEIYADRSSDGTPIKPYRVKEEPCSSPPTSAYKLSRTETMDLDDPAPNVLQTPRHPRKSLSNHADSPGTSRRQRRSSAPLTQSVREKNVGKLNLTRTAAPQPIASIEARAISEPAELTQVEDTVLRPLDSNIVTSVPEEPPTKRSRRAQAQNREKHDFLAESGEAPPAENGERVSPHVARQQMNSRLRALKKIQTPTKAWPKTSKLGPPKIKKEQVPTPPSSSSRARDTPVRAAAKSRSKARDDPTPDRPVWTMKPPETRSNARKNRDVPAKDQGRLRDKDVRELSGHDFKPNPAYNQGYSYAFTETVRKRGDRMCLPGCTNAQCCGSTFRALAEAQAPLSSSQEEVLLENYLGDAYSSMQLTQMSSEERQELVLQARTMKMAKESGKHREAYERRKTPPGFWRVDFPTTQEQQEDRERAKEQEKAVVQERWLEAQRKGGRWIFRDE
ncbi:DNA repair protein-CtIP [Pyrenophora tritici-repentis]|nr:DNA repair protein-CtIP [Pyrenophora tritici-repentis]